MFGTKEAGLTHPLARLLMHDPVTKPQVRPGPIGPTAGDRFDPPVGTQTFFATSHTLWWSR
ncbi:MAG: hypothetical protein E6K14_02355 [Methanobacteriota archaeon]|nr:MAG: hypothetical protein E6K14_02355 [Euryarchaeota archaeon]